MDLQPGVHSGDDLLRHKTLWRFAYDAARQRMLGPDCPEIFDVVLYNERREVTETSIANIAVEVEDGTWRTPPISCGLLPGVMRDALLAEGKLQESVLTVEELRAAVSKGLRIICYNSVRGVYLVELSDDRFHGLRPR